MTTSKFDEARTAVGDLDDHFNKIEGAIAALDIIVGNMNDDQDGAAVHFVTNGIREAMEAARETYSAAMDLLTPPKLGQAA